MDKRAAHGRLTGEVVQQRSWLRRNLVNRLFRLGNAIQTQTQQLLTLNSELSVVHYRILLRLSQAGPQNVQGIAELLGANRSLVSRVLPTLRERGWVEAVHHQTDKRQLIVQLSAQGQAVIDAHRGPVDVRYEALHAAFTAEEFETLLEYLDRLDAITGRDASHFAPELSEEMNGEDYE